MKIIPVLIAISALCAVVHSSPASAAVNPGATPLDFAAIRGANYCSARGNHNDHWLYYDPRETERDLDYAKKIGINQVRVFLSYDEELRLAETAANILEANQLVAMRELPTRKVDRLRQAPPDLPALRACLADLVTKLEPYQGTGAR
jgi:hypothetical protein